MIQNQQWIDFYEQQEVVRKMIIKGDNDSEQFWIEQEKMITLQLEACSLLSFDRKELE